MARRFLALIAPLLVVVALLLAAQPAAAQQPSLYSAAFLESDADLFDTQVLPPTARSCLDLESEEIRLSFEPVTFDVPGFRSRTELCLLYRELDDAYHVVLFSIESTEHFRTAKEIAAAMLDGAGFDLCAIGVWDFYSGRRISLTPDDLLSVPAVCAPRVRTLAADGQVGAVIDGVRDAVLDTADLTARQMAWQPNRALTVLVLMETEPAVEYYRRFVTGLPRAEVERRARAGRSVTGIDAFAGPRVLLNLLRTSDEARRSGRPLQEEARLDAVVFMAHEYTHFAQDGISGDNDAFPMWFLEGQAAYQEERNGGVRPLYRDEAARLLRMNRALRLSEIAEANDWFAQEARAGSNAVYSRAYAAVALIIERHGFDATVALLRDNHGGSIDTFNALLAELTGQELDAFDAAVNVWLQGAPVTTTPPPTTAVPPTTTTPPPAPPATGAPPPMPAPPAATGAPAGRRYTGGDSANRVRVDFTVSSDGRTAEGSLTVVGPVACANVGAQLTFRYAIRADGGFAGSVPSGQALVTLDVRIQGATAEGTFTYTDTAAGCDSGRITFIARATP